MLKLNASYSKKVPAQGEYSSQSYHVSLEIELPSDLSTDEVQNKIAETFELCRDAVENELKPNDDVKHATHTTPTKKKPEEDEPTASSKQVSYLNLLAKRNKIDIASLLKKHSVNNVYHLTRKQCATLIDELQAA